jgi:2-polyprenyl-3-methyl-5-hydroxy-6-metoxy-1,4-benzoquinol methylase
MHLSQPAKSPCIVCGSFNLFNVVINSKLSYCLCEACGHCKLLVSSNSVAFENAQKKYFSEKFQTLTGFSTTQVDNNNKFKLSILSNLFHRPGKVIEVGPGVGLFADKLFQKGHEITLIEHSRDLVNLLRNKNKFIVYEGEFETMTIKNNMFDLFVSLHVIEHVVDPVQHLSKAIEIVKPGGYALIATPNARSWQQRLFPLFSPNFDSAHLRVYSLDSLKTSCEKVGWIVKAQYTPEPVTGWIRVITKVIRRIRNEDEEITAGKYSAQLSKKLSYLISLFSLISYPFRIIQEKFFGGNEIILICQKKG